MKSVTEQTWRQRGIWRDGRIRSNASKKLRDVSLFFLLFALFGAAPMVGLLAAFFADDSEMTFQSGLGNIIFQLTIIALLIFLLTKVGKAWKIWQRWKECFLEIQPMPAYLGRTLQGKLTIPADLGNGSIMRCSLGCYRSRRRSNRKQMFNKGIPLWESDAVKTHVSTGQKSITVQFILPKSRPESSWTDPHDRVNWILSVKATDDSSMDYEVPVFFNPDE